IEGHISYARWVSMDASAWKFGYWGVVFLVVALLMGNWFFAGGALSCLYEFVRFRAYARRLRMQPKPIPSASL
nr:hypothetical protein [Anaerolineae bacterium]